MKKLYILFGLMMALTLNSEAQDTTTDTSVTKRSKKVVKTTVGKEQYYQLKDSTILIYPKPKYFSFITNLPKDGWETAKTPFKKENLKSTALVAAATGLLILVDQPVIDGVRKFSDNIRLNPDGKYNDILKIKVGSTNIKIIRLPENLNTAFYQLGQGFPGLLVGGGLYVYGKINNSYRDISTASQLTEAFILMGVGTQIIKRSTGRQSPFVAIADGGKWQPFPSFSNYQKNTSNYDAFPSGHLATVMSVVTILAENYPEKKYIRPVGYTLMGLVGYSMLNNEVHWISDYPLAIALGYMCAKQVVKRNRSEIKPSGSSKIKPELDYTLSYVNGVIMPGIRLKF